MDRKPSEDKIHEMMMLIENTFRSNLGANVNGMKTAVEQVYKAVHNKVSRVEIDRLISIR